MNDELMYEDYNPDDSDEDGTASYRSPDISIKRYRDERYKGKVSNVIGRHYRKISRKCRVCDEEEIYKDKESAGYENFKNLTHFIHLSSISLL